MFLTDYLDGVMARPWAWGSLDCCFFAGDWIRNATGRDPLGPYRGRYANAIKAARLITRAGSLHGLVAPEMQRCGFMTASTPQTGDIAILPILAADDHVAARASVVIADGPWWIGLTLDGIAGVRAEPGVIWRVLGGGDL